MVRICVYIAALSVLLSSCNILNEKNKHPNVILVLAENQGWGDVGFHGNEIIHTPNLDKLASKSIVLNRFYVSPVPRATHYSIITGKYFLKTESEKSLTLAEVFNEAGYSTVYFGKSFHGIQASQVNSYKGIDSIKILSADTLTDAALNYMGSQKKPYFLMLTFHTPQVINQFENKLIEKYKNKGLDDKTAEVYSIYENLDHNVGRLIDKLKEQRQFKNTIFIYTSNCGPDYLRYNGGYKGRKAQVDEGSIRVPFIISYPKGNFKHRIIDSEFITHLDLFPTLLNLCNIQSPSCDFDGIDVSNILQNNKLLIPDREFYTCLSSNSDTLYGAVRNKDYLLTIYPWETALFMLKTDPYQKKDIAADSILLTRKLLRKYCQWYSEINGEKLNLNSCLELVDKEHHLDNHSIVSRYD